VRVATYQVEAEVKRRHWWFRGRRRILAHFLARLDPPLPAGARVLEIGCGTGANGPVLAGGGRFAVGIDTSLIALALAGASERGHAARVRGDALALPFADASFDLVAALDVLEHVGDHAAAVRELRRVLRPRGAVVIFVPALRFLWSLQDEVSHHLRRYGRAELRALLAGAELQIERLTFFNTLLFPTILAGRLAMRLRTPADLQSEAEIGGPLLNAILLRVFSAEASLLDHTDLPIGVSLACVARK
jgi:SAM-dependent methyltransferase